MAPLMTNECEASIEHHCIQMVEILAKLPAEVIGIQCMMINVQTTKCIIDDFHPLSSMDFNRSDGRVIAK